MEYFVKRKLIIFIVLQTILYAAYNPFFKDNNSPAIKKQTYQKKVTIPTSKRKNIKMTYFGFVDGDKGRFALVSFKKKNIVIRENSNLYIAQEILKVKKITSNYIVLQDRQGRIQSIYFSSTKDNQRIYEREI